MVIQCPYGRGKLDLSKKQLSVKEKLWFIQEWKQRGRSLEALCEKYNIPSPRVRKWVELARANGQLYSGHGRPPCLSPESKEKLKEELLARTYRTSLVDFQDMVHSKRVAEAEAAGMPGALVKRVSRTTVANLMKELGAEVKNAEFTTQARADATSSVRNAVSFYAMAKYAQEILKISPMKLLNSDGSSFTVGATEQDCEKVVCIRDEREVKVEIINQAVAAKGKATFGLYTIKIYLTINANGNVFSPVFIIQDETMDSEAFEVNRVPELGATAELGSEGFVVFLKSRTGNRAFYNWVFSSLIVEAVQRVNQFYPDLRDTPAFWKLDGESVQIAPCSDSVVQQTMRDNNIHVGKSPHSCTGIYQECDCGNIFKAAKTVNRKLNDKIIHAPFVRATLESIFKAHNDAMNSTSSNEQPTLDGRKKSSSAQKCKKLGLSTYHTKLAIGGILRVQLALQTTLKIQSIRDSFLKAGTFPLSLPQMLQQLRVSKKVDKIEELGINQSVDDLVQAIAEKGEISEEDLDNANVRPDAHEKRKRRDELVIYRRRALILTHIEVRKREYPATVVVLNVRTPVVPRAETPQDDLPNNKKRRAKAVTTNK